MASITILKLDDEVKTLLQAQAKRNNRSMEEEARIILRDAVNGQKKENESKSTSRSPSGVFRFYFGPEKDVDLNLQPRTAGMREPPRFE